MRGTGKKYSSIAEMDAYAKKLNDFFMSNDWELIHFGKNIQNIKPTPGLSSYTVSIYFLEDTVAKIDELSTGNSAELRIFAGGPKTDDVINTLTSLLE